MTAVLFPFGARLTTWLAATVFLVVAVRQRRWEPLLAGVAWMWSFEIAFQAVSLATGKLPVGPDGPIFYIVVGCPLVAWIVHRGIRPNPWVSAAALLVFVIWIASGFHVNGHTMTGFSPAAEALNEGAKTLWAAAWLVPLHPVRGRFAVRRPQLLDSRI